jgi:hypothetical protein
VNAAKERAELAQRVFQRYGIECHVRQWHNGRRGWFCITDVGYLDLMAIAERAAVDENAEFERVYEALPGTKSRELARYFWDARANLSDRFAP